MYWKLINKIVILIFLTVLIFSCGGGGSSNGDGSNTTKNGGTVYSTALRRVDNGVKYPVKVYLPPGYELDALASYPVLYVLDAEWRFSTTVSMVEERNKSIIIVGVGNTDRQVTGRRAVDYRMPGARSYYQFLINQVIPYVDANYRVDIENRTLSGHSLGGLFTGLAVLLEDPDNRYFSHYLSQDGSFWDQQNVTRDLEEEYFVLGKGLDAQVIIGGALLDDGNGEDAEWFYDLLDVRSYEGIDLMHWIYVANHSQDFELSMAEYLDFAY